MAKANLTSVSPLMQPVEYNGKQYYTSQYFHQQYIANSQAGGKYRQHKHFLHLLRSMEAYGIYLQQGDIHELTWSQVHSLDSNQGQYVVTGGNPIWISFKPLFQATGYQPLTLLNATAQLALSHHLDDEFSKQMSVAANTTVARQQQPDAALTPAEMFLVHAQNFLAQERRLAALTSRVETHHDRLETHADRLEHLEAVHTPPVGKLTPGKYLADAGKPRLPGNLYQVFVDHARRLESPERWTAPGDTWPRSFWRPEILGQAYALATRQLSLIK